MRARLLDATVECLVKYGYSGTSVISTAQIGELVAELGRLAAVLGEATGAERADVYASLGLRLDYDPHGQRVTATADLSRVAGRVRGGT